MTTQVRLLIYTDFCYFRSGIPRLPKQHGLPPNCFISAEVVEWCFQHVKGVNTVKCAISLLQVRLLHQKPLSVRHIRSNEISHVNLDMHNYLMSIEICHICNIPRTKYIISIEIFDIFRSIYCFFSIRTRSLCCVMRSLVSICA